MRKLLISLALLLLLAVPALAEDTQLIDCNGFTIEVPAAWTVDVDEYSRATHTIVNHVLHPTVVFAGNEDYKLVLTLNDYPSDIRYRLAGQGHRAQEHFNVVAEHSGLTAVPGVASSRMVQALADVRVFGMCQVPGKDDHLATYFNKDKGLGYVFRLTRKSAAVTADAADALLLQIASSLREDGLFYPSDATDRIVVITHATANIRVAPEQESEKLKTAAQGESFPYYGQTSSWYIINVDGVTGYVSTALSELK